MFRKISLVCVLVLLLVSLSCSTCFAQAGPSGYETWTDGMYIQWVSEVYVSSGGSATVTFPTPFPNNCYIVMATEYSNSSRARSYFTPNDVTLSGCTIKSQSGAPSTFCSVIAIGN